MSAQCTLCRPQALRSGSAEPLEGDAPLRGCGVWVVLIGRVTEVHRRHHVLAMMPRVTLCCLTLTGAPLHLAAVLFGTISSREHRTVELLYLVAAVSLGWLHALMIAKRLD